MDKLYAQKDVDKIISRAVNLQEKKKELYHRKDIETALEELNIEKDIIAQSIEEYVPKRISKSSNFNFFFNREKGKDKFIYVPSINLWIAKERTHLNKNWFECHQLLQQENKRMPTIPEFIEFLKYCRENYEEVYKEITEVRNPWRTEWLDAYFKIKGKDLYINCNHVLDPKGNLIPKNSEILDKNTLRGDKTPGISLDDYLDSNHTSQGPPTKKVKTGDLFYWCPRSDNNAVARFNAYSYRAFLSCNRNPYYRNSILGVRAVRHE